MEGVKKQKWGGILKRPLTVWTFMIFGVCVANELSFLFPIYPSLNIFCHFVGLLLLVYSPTLLKIC